THSGNAQLTRQPLLTRNGHWTEERRSDRLTVQVRFFFERHTGHSGDNSRLHHLTTYFGKPRSRYCQLLRLSCYGSVGSSCEEHKRERTHYHAPRAHTSMSSQRPAASVARAEANVPRSWHTVQPQASALRLRHVRLGVAVLHVLLRQLFGTSPNRWRKQRLK